MPETCNKTNREATDVGSEKKKQPKKKKMEVKNRDKRNISFRRDKTNCRCYYVFINMQRIPENGKAVKSHSDPEQSEG